MKSSKSAIKQATASEQKSIVVAALSARNLYKSR